VFTQEEDSPPTKTGPLYSNLKTEKHVQYLMNGTINLHWYDEIRIADGLWEENNTQT